MVIGKKVFSMHKFFAEAFDKEIIHYTFLLMRAFVNCVGSLRTIRTSAEVVFISKLELFSERNEPAESSFDRFCAWQILIFIKFRRRRIATAFLMEPLQTCFDSLNGPQRRFCHRESITYVA